MGPGGGNCPCDLQYLSHFGNFGGMVRQQHRQVGIPGGKGSKDSQADKVGGHRYLLLPT